MSTKVDQEKQSEFGKEISELVRRHDGSGNSICMFGRVVKDFGFSDSEYSDLCKEHGKLTQEEFEKSADDCDSQESCGEKRKPKKKAAQEQTFFKDRFITFLASDETVDSYGDILRVDGCDLSRMKSGAAAFITSHDIRNISGASGIIVKAWKAKNIEGSPEGKAILVTVYFPTFEEDPDADYIFKKFKAGTLKAVSVGLQVFEAYYPEDPNERKKLGLGKYGVEVRKWMPYELSAVTVGANPNALMRRAIEDSELKKVIKEVVSEVLSEKNISTQNDQKPSGKPEGNSAPEALPGAQLRCYMDCVDVKVNINLNK